MAIEVVDTVCEPGGAKPNEDRLGFGPHAAWVLDGATDVYPQPFLPAHNDVHYLVDRLGDFLTDHAAAAITDDPQTLLDHVSKRMRADLAALGFPPDRTHPTCSLGLLIDRGDTLELTRIGDATLVTAGRTVTVVDTDFYNHREAAAVAAAGPAGLSGAEARTALLSRRQEYITGVHAEGVFSGHPDARLRVHSTTLGWDGIEHVLLCTDGFARAIGEYGLYADWPTLIKHALDDSLASIAKTIRDHEHRQDLDLLHAHFKTSDDLAAVLCRRR
ncbi:protein phosphatase 2C domain-containing protein [Catenulispora sp. NF23]|uniref:protein phosphatase 2C domain-containing protein n=1 Tax=Catenulispora pinistramenti TaxID=2705254 RepID=UPI001BAB55AA|nr:protein phosphatase 2C domain-containing protein [Catenulispora pinistramenti]MBS2532572.1 protein phosphatase 2C domain-containing protein [Catenulispora pinistramenti]